MNPLLRWLTSPEWTHVVGTLLHSLWQGALIAIALAVLMRRLTNPVSRYRCALGMLGMLVIASIITWAVLNAPTPTTPNASPVPAAESEFASTPPTALNLNPTDKVVVVGKMSPPAASTNWTAWLALVWILGATAMLLRAGIKVAGAENLRRSCKPMDDERMLTLVAEACRAVELARKIRVAVTDKLTSPAVVGIIVPTLILPLSLFSALTPEQIRFVLLHELAHIRRGDYLANLFQLFAEALLFFNPAVWWISHQIRREREACCDALAIELSGAPADYARTLVRVAENILQPMPTAALAFGDDGREPSPLADRVQRLLVPGYRPALRLTWRAMLTALLVGGALLLLSAVGTRNTVGAILTSSQPPATANTLLPAPSPTNVTEQMEPTTSTNSDVAMEILRGSSSSSIEANGETVTATNGAVVKFNNQKLTADFVRVNQKTGDIVARGNVRLETTNGTYSGSVMTLNLKSNFVSGTDYRLTLPKYTISSAGAFIPALSGEVQTGTFGMDGWTLDGQNQTNQQWFWYRTGGKTYATEVVATNVSKAEPLSVRADGGLVQTYNSILRADHRLNIVKIDDEVYFNRQPLREIIRELSERAKQGDPEKTGVEFILAPDRAGIDPATGLPWATTSEELNSVTITSRYRIAGPLRFILDSIVSFADKPIKYTFTNNIVRFSLRSASESEPLFTREFELPAKTFYGKIQTNLPPAELNRVASSNLAPMALEGFRTWLNGIGVNMDPKQGKSLYYKDRKGVLLARATLAELDAIEMAVMSLNEPTAALATRTFNVMPQKLGEVIEAAVPQFKPVSATNVTAGLRALFLSAGVDLTLPKSIFYNDRAGGLFIRATKEDLDTIESLLQVIGRQPAQVNLKVRWVEMPQAFASSMLLSSPTNALPLPIFRIQKLCGVLTDKQTTEVLDLMKSRNGFTLLNEGQITTQTERQAQLQHAEIKTVVTSINPKAFTKPGVSSTNLLITQNTPLGPVIDIFPSVSADETKISLHTITTITEFLGYEKPAKQVPVYVDGKKTTTTFPQPKYRIQTMTNDCVIPDGQTLVLGNPTTTEVTTTTDGKVVNTTVSETKTNLLFVFITATLVDSAGNPTKLDMGIPSMLPLR